MDEALQIVILAAGLGTRMKSRHAKVLHAAGGRPLVEHVVRTAAELTAPENIVVVTGHQAERVEAALNGLSVRFVRQLEQKGTGHALLVCREALAGRPGRIVVLYGDCPLLSSTTLRDFVALHAREGSTASLITTLLDDPTGYGRILRDAQGRVTGIVEQKAATPEQLAIREINSGIYCFEAAPFWSALSRVQPNNPAREYYLTDVIGILHEAGAPLSALCIDDAAELLGINTRVELAQVDRIFRDRKRRELQLAGVTLELPETILIDAGVTAGADTQVGPFVQLRGTTSIGEDCVIGAGAILVNVTLGDRAVVHPYSILHDTTLETEAEAGPFARLRMNAHVEAGAHVGNFVELKKTRLGRGSKSMHLAYLGDSTIGAGVNIGAGTITCNYDGVKKHPTVIGDGAFVGSNSTLVAPLEVGGGSYVAAGSVITENVPAEVLALGRARQVVKENWKKKRS